MIADAAGITTGAIYHYFDSKLHIYEAVLDEVQERVYALFEAAERTGDTFVDKLDAVYEAAHQLNRADTSLAQFLGASRIDRRRNAELAESLGPTGQRGERFFEAIVQRGIETGEIDAADQDRVLSFIRAFNIGLTDGLSGDHEQHRQAVDGLMLALRGMVSVNTRAASRAGN